MSIDERLANTDFPLPAIRQVNMARHATAISLGLGELKDFPVDEQVLHAMEQAMRNGGTNYTANAGLPELREAVAKNQQQVDGFAYTTDNVIVTIGVQNALYAVVKTLAKLGAKRILIPEINFGIYRKIPMDFRFEVITYPLTADFGIDLDALATILQTDDLLLINSPANPTGRIFSGEEQEALAKILEQKLHRGYVISDEIYSQLVYEGELAQSFSKYFERTIVLNGISKSAAAAGLRVGWVVTQNKKLAQAITSNNATVISCPPTINQAGAIPVVEGKTRQSILQYNKVLKENSLIAAELLESHKIPFVKPTGSFYVFPKISHLLPVSVKEFCLQCAQREQGVVVIPGEAFGAPDYIRISLASDQVKVGMMRLLKLLNVQ